MLDLYNHTYYDLVQDSIDHVQYSLPVKGLDTVPMVEAWANSYITSVVFVVCIILAIIATGTAHGFVASSYKDFFNLRDHYYEPRQQETRSNIIGIISYWLLSILGYTLYICINIDIFTHQTATTTTYISPLLGVATMALVTAYFVVKFALLKVIGVIYHLSAAINQLCKHYFFLILMLGLAALIISIVEIYSTTISHEILHLTFFSVLSITLLGAILKSIQIFFRGYYSLYYYLLYLCTLEILPICLLIEVGKKWFEIV